MIQNKPKKISFNVKLKKYKSQSKYRFIQHHTLNKSPAKNVPSFKTGSERLLQPKSISPDKFYDLPEFKTKKSASFGFGTKTNFAKKQYVEPTRYNITSSFGTFSTKKIPGPSFGISRQDFYKGNSQKNNEKVGPGIYNTELMRKKMTFYIGKKFKRNDETQSPGPGTYNLRTQESLIESRQERHTQKLKAPKIRTQYFEKEPLERHNNKVPGPGRYEVSWFPSTIQLQIKKIKKPKLPQCPRFKQRQQKIPAPGAYQLFSQFGG